MGQIHNLVRREVVQTAQTLVVKVGTNVLSSADGALDVDRISSISEQIYQVLQTGRKVVVVSSGAVGAGMSVLRQAKRPQDLSHLQASAATGQAYLIRLYDDCLRKHGCHAAQLLLTADDFKQRSRYLNVRNTLNTLFEYGVVPIVNENDTISIDEIKFGDNDRLAAMVTNLLPAPLLVILTSVDGLYAGNPRAATSRVIPLVERWDDALLNLVIDDNSPLGTGGMRSKLEAVRMATAVGENVLIANGTEPGILSDILQAKEIGTLFLAEGAIVPAWKRWIGYTVPPQGQFYLDAGACEALVKRGRSLLAIGITRIEGDFAKGEVVSLFDETGTEFARGLTNYDFRDARAIVGKRTEEIAEVFGGVPYGEVIHRDNLVLIH